MVERIAPFCGTAKTTPHNAVFLQALDLPSPQMPRGWTATTRTSRSRGGRAFSHVYAGWAFSQPFYKQELYRELGFTSLEDFIIGFWEKRYARRAANNLLSMLRTWQLSDVGSTVGYGGSLERALGAIKAKPQSWRERRTSTSRQRTSRRTRHAFRRSLPGDSVPLGSHGRCRPQLDGFAVH
jgi:homoserine O-acetyltransferase/O-succinyltransferase